jgi:Zn finger protein HypA/HybF involved in hydrogenase expression
MNSTNANAGQAPVLRYPTKINVICRICGHPGRVRIFLEDVNRLICSACGSRTVRVVDRDRTAAWARRRITK